MVTLLRYQHDCFETLNLYMEQEKIEYEKGVMLRCDCNNIWVLEVFGLDFKYWQKV